MSGFVLVVLVILHILLAVLWLALSVRLQTQVKLAVDPDLSVGEVGRRGSRATVRAMSVLIVLFYVAAVAAFIVGGGASVYGPVYHTSLLLGLLLVLEQFLILQRAVGQLADGHVDARKRVAMGIGVAHLLWGILFVLMFFGPKWLSAWSA